MPDYFPPGGAGSFTPPTGSGFVKVTGGVLDTASSSLSATEILAALASGKWPIFTLASVGGTANAITATFGVTLATGQFFWLIPAATSSSTTVNLDVDSVGDKRIKAFDGSTDPAVEDLVINRLTLLYYDGTVFRQMLGGAITTAPGWPAGLTATELGYLDGVTSAIQTQLNARLALAGGTMTGVLYFSGTFGGSSGSTWIGNDGSGPIFNWPSGAGVFNWPSGAGVNLQLKDQGTTYELVGKSGIQYPAAHTAPGSTVYGSWRDSFALYNQGGGGSVVNAAKLVSRANSTAYSICLAPTGDVIRCLLQDSSSKRAVALVDASGTVTFEAGSHADYVVGSSPASGEVGAYILSGVLTIKPGSAGARSIAADVARAQA